jgi:hypothetical protein
MFSATCSGARSAAAAAFSMSCMVMCAEFPWSLFGSPHPQLAHMACPFRSSESVVGAYPPWSTRNAAQAIWNDRFDKPMALPSMVISTSDRSRSVAPKVTKSGV